MRVFVTVISLIVLSACTTSRTMMVARNEAMLSVQSHNALVGADAVATRTLQEAAKLTTVQGFRYFKIVDAQDTTRNISMFVPGTAYSSGTVSAFGNTAAYNESTTYQPPHLMSEQWVGDRVKVKMFPDGAPEAATEGVYDAKLILARR